MLFRSYDGGAVLALARRVGTPLVLDFHHQRVLRGDGGLAELVRGAAQTWRARARSEAPGWGQAEGEVPKFHLSSPASAARPRDHAEFIAASDAEVALSALGAAGLEAADVMLECKAKDAAVFRLVADLAATGRWVADGEAGVRQG